MFAYVVSIKLREEEQQIEICIKRKNLMYFMYNKKKLYLIAMNYLFMFSRK